MNLWKPHIKNARTGSRRPPLRKAPLSISVAVRPMTDQEARQFEAAVDLLLADTIRQHLGRVREEHETTIS